MLEEEIHPVHLSQQIWALNPDVLFSNNVVIVG